MAWQRSAHVRALHKGRSIGAEKGTPRLTGRQKRVESKGVRLAQEGNSRLTNR